MSQLIALLAWLAIPVLLVVAYDHWFAEPKRPKKADGEREPPPTWVAIANYLAPVVAIAAVVHIGIHEVFTWAKQIAGPMSWLAAPVGLLCLIDSWFFAPRRAIAAGTVDAPDPPLMAAAYFLLPFLVVAVIVRMISAESLDFSVVLLSLSIVTGAIWAIDNWFVRPRRERAAAAAAGGKPLVLAEPGSVDYARSFFPVAFIVLIVRAFIFEPFRIPSDSMMPTLLDGDFIVVSKYSYGLRLPVINKTILSTGTPQRGDVVVFRYPPDPNVNFIKRLVGLPGDRIQVRDDHLIINGETIELKPEGRFTDGCYVGLKLSTETLGTHTHQVMSCQAPDGLQSTRSAMMNGDGPFPACDRRELARRGGYFCQERSTADNPDSGDHDFGIVPAGHYLMIGDNRDNSLDSRVWSYVPDANLVGKATRIWFNLDPQRSKPFNWSRIGDSIE